MEQVSYKRNDDGVSLRAGVLLHRWFFGPGQILPPEKSPAAEPMGWTSPSYCDQCVRIQVYASWSSFPKQTNAIAHYNSEVNLQPKDAVSCWTRTATVETSTLLCTQAELGRMIHAYNWSRLVTQAV